MIDNTTLHRFHDPAFELLAREAIAEMAEMAESHELRTNPPNSQEV